mmetsp:Transcript_23059/g.36722  ORF Transcript_23059/g.36722 Transcript_23059/m.36722 type:complete len:250 (+) Transcript_23059:912-1661(+)
MRKRNYKTLTWMIGVKRSKKIGKFEYLLCPEQLLLVSSSRVAPHHQGQHHRKKQEYHEVVFGVDTFSDNSSYSAMLVRANEEENLKDMVALNIFYESGTDHKGRSILIFVAAKLASPGLNLDRLLLHMIKTADGLVLNPRGYVLVYLDHTCSIDYLPSISWLKALYDDVLGRKYKKNIQAMYIVHPTWQLKALFWGAMPFISSKFWEKHHYVDTLSELYTFIPSERVLLPKIAYHTDKQAVEELNSSFF